jgi:anti-sigma factor RsiW
MKELWEKTMKEKLEQAVTCDRAEDLVSYLYGEADAGAAAAFRRHLEQCASCNEEVAAFSRVREDVVEWRNRSLPSFDSLNARAFSERVVAERKRSALAALREFFTLAPMWMRAATAVAAVLVCALIVFTAMHFSEPRPAVVQVVPNAPTQAQVDEMVKQQVAAELRRKEQEAGVSAPQKPSVEVAVNNGSPSRPKVKKQSAATASVARLKNRAVPDKVKSSQQEARQQLAELVQTSREDDGLPRLSDLIDDSNEAQ